MNNIEIDYDCMMTPEKILMLHNALYDDMNSVTDTIIERINLDAKLHLGRWLYVTKLTLIEEMSEMNKMMAAFMKHRMETDSDLLSTDPDAFVRNRLVEMKVESEKLENVKRLVKACWPDVAFEFIV